MAAAEITRTRAWLIATRPQTLPAGIAPVIVGTAIAIEKDVFAIWPAMAALIGALLIQIGTNFANDYFDAKRGVDTDDREGFTRVTHAGLIEPVAVRRAMAASFAAAILIGTYLVYIGGMPIVVIGLVSVACGVAYAGGPFPFGSYGLGDLFVFVFFGLVATAGTYYVQAVTTVTSPFPLWLPSGTVSSLAILAGVAMGALTTAILVVNNLRDIETDREAGKYTLAVYLGKRYTKVEFVGLLLLAYAIPVLLVNELESWLVGLPLLSIPYAVIITRTVVWGPGGSTLNHSLEATGRLLVVYTGLLAIGVIMA